MDHQGTAPGQHVGVQEDTPEHFVWGNIREKDWFQKSSLVMGEITHVFTLIKR